VLHDNVPVHILRAALERDLAFEEALEPVGDLKRPADILLHNDDADPAAGTAGIIS